MSKILDNLLWLFSFKDKFLPLMPSVWYHKAKDSNTVTGQITVKRCKFSICRQNCHFVCNQHCVACFCSRMTRIKTQQWFGFWTNPLVLQPKLKEFYQRKYHMERNFEYKEVFCLGIFLFKRCILFSDFRLLWSISEEGLKKRAFLPSAECMKIKLVMFWSKIKIKNLFRFKLINPKFSA